MADGLLRMADYIQARDLRGDRTIKLVDVVPLSTPWTMFIDPSSACNFNCQFCPTGHPELLKKIKRKATLMEFDLFTRIISDLQYFPQKLRQLNLYKDGEPLLNPHFTDMVECARYANIAERIWVKTNGSRLNPALNKKLIACGLDMLGISAFTKQGFRDIAGVDIDYQEYRANIKDLHGRGLPISIKVADTGLSDKEKQTFLDDFGDICDYIAIEGLHGWSASSEYDFKLGTNNNFDGTPRAYKIACPLTMYMLTVSANGAVSVCNDDWQLAHDIGDANTESLMCIWNGTRLHKFRMMHLNGNRHENLACNDCDYLQALPDSIDDSLEILKGRL